MNIQQRVDQLREKMAERGLEAYIIPTSDPHQSEYVPAHYKDREFISGFTGSAGTAIVTQEECGLWTDSRYFLQAEEELKGSPFRLYRMGTEDPTTEEFLKDHVSAFGKIGFNGLTMATSSYKKLSQSMGTRLLLSDMDFVGDIWEDRPALPHKPAYFYPEKYTGSSIEEKLTILRYMMKDREADYTFIGSLTDSCYLFNIRGWDVEDTPVVLCYSLISQDRALLFIDSSKLTQEVEEPLKKAGVEIYNYDAVFDTLEKIPGQKVVYLDQNYVNITAFQSLSDNVKIKNGMNLTTLMKAIKNEVEIANTKKAFLKDGIALVKFFNWVETGAKTGGVNEKSAANRLQRFRQEQGDFLEDSFAAIVGYGANAAIVHYDPMKNDQPATIQEKGLLLVDSGAQYIEGTTDITRTYAMGPTTDEEKEDYTLVLKAHIAGMNAVFPKGTKGNYLHSIVREPLLRHHKDFHHGTGHGVGHMLGVHEGPQNFGSNDRGIEIVPGMVTSMEPGLYIAGSHGIRTESITLCVEDEKNEFGQFLKLESLTWVPIDTRPLKVELMEDWELQWLNAYNAHCEELLRPYLEGEELAYLVERCKEVSR